jgi:Leucine-rich repeat (LRR) protein
MMNQKLCENNCVLQDNGFVFCTGFDPANLSYILNSLSALIHELDLVDEVRQRANRMSNLVLKNYHSLTELPLDKLAAVFPNISVLIVYQCLNLNDMSSLFSSFPNLATLSLEGCHDMKSLDFLSHAPIRGLQLLDINDCGLVYSPSWEKAIQALSQSDIVELHIMIENCKELQLLPPSIGLLGAKLWGLNLENLPKLTQLPAEIGNLQNLRLLVIKDTSIRHLPQEIGRLEGCGMVLSGDKMICPPKCFRGSVEAMRTYFARKRLRVFKGLVRLAILFGRSRCRAVERIYMPDGIGYKLCREHFLETSYKHARNE